MSAQRALALLLLLALWGCDEAPDLAAIPRIPPEEFCTQWLNNVLLQRDRCDDNYLTPEQERDRLEACQDHILRGIQRGVISYDGQAVTRCLLEQRQTCNDSFTTKSCETLQGLLEVGEVCYSKHECSSGRCPLTDQCPGTCGEVAPPGGRCDPLPCAQGSYCDDNFVCVLRAPEGSPCTRDRHCEEQLSCLCFGDYACELISSDEEHQGVCAAMLPNQPEGAPCGVGRYCSGGFFCLTPIGGAPDGGGICKPQARPGERCPIGGGDLGWLTQGCQGAVCLVTDDPLEGVCALVREGDPCVQAKAPDGATFLTCNLDTYCDEATGLCALHESTSAPRCVRP
jgi:hypothetical protein